MLEHNNTSTHSTPPFQRCVFQPRKGCAATTLSALKCRETQSSRPAKREQFLVEMAEIKKRLKEISRWWFQTFVIFTPKIGEDFQFD